MFGSPENPLYDTTGAAEFLGMAKKSLECMRCARRGPNYVKLGRLVRYRQSDLQAWIDSNIKAVIQPKPVKGSR